MPFCVILPITADYSLVTLIFLRSEPWDCMSRGEQGKQHAWEPVGHSTLTDWKKYSGIFYFKLCN